MSETLLYKGDCLELMKNIKDKSVDMILCDLPYGTTQASFDTVIPFEPLWEQYKRIIKIFIAQLDYSPAGRFFHMRERRNNHEYP